MYWPTYSVRCYGSRFRMCIQVSLLLEMVSDYSMGDQRLRTSQSFFLVYYHVLPWHSRVGEYCWKRSFLAAGNGSPLPSPQLQTYCSLIRPVWICPMWVRYLNGQWQSWDHTRVTAHPLVIVSMVCLASYTSDDLHAEIEDVILIAGIGHRACTLSAATYSILYDNMVTHWNAAGTGRYTA